MLQLLKLATKELVHVVFLFLKFNSDAASFIIFRNFGKRTEHKNINVLFPKLNLGLGN